MTETTKSQKKGWPFPSAQSADQSADSAPTAHLAEKELVDAQLAHDKKVTAALDAELIDEESDNPT